MKFEELEEFGLTSNESKVYLELIKKGISTASDLTKETKLHRTNVYDSLDRLSQKGLLNHVTISKTKHYSATDPEHLKTLLKEKELKLASIIPQLKLLEKTSGKSKSNLGLFDGIIGIKTIVFDILETVPEKGEVYTFGNPGNVSERMKYFINQYHLLRIEKKIRQYHIYNDDAKERLKQLNNMEYTFADYVPKEYNSPVSTTIYGNKVAFFIWGDEPVGILIDNELMAKTYKTHFDLLMEVIKQRS